MAKEWILNIATNRWGLNKKESVGPVSLWIRECQPKTLDDWQRFYYQKLSDFLRSKRIPFSSEEYLTHLGDKLYTKISEVILAEVEQITEEDCQQYIRQLVLNRTYEGYQTEIETIYQQLQKALQITIHPAPDEWDRIYNVDFYIPIHKWAIGIQIKPITFEQTPEIHKWSSWLRRTHAAFTQPLWRKGVYCFLGLEEPTKNHSKSGCYRSNCAGNSTAQAQT